MTANGEGFTRLLVPLLAESGGSCFHKAAGGIVQLSGEALPIWKRATRLQAADIAVYSLNRTTGNDSN